MTALAANRDTPRLGDESVVPMREMKVDASVHCYQGGIAVINAGYVRPGRASTTDIVAGVFVAEADNSSGAAGDITARVRRGCFRFKSGTAGDAIAQADVGKVCYVIDDQTVGKTDGTGSRIKAGIIEMIDPSGDIWVEITGPTAAGA